MQRMILATACAALSVLGCKVKPAERERNEQLVATARASTRHAELSPPRPILAVRDLRASQAYYRDALGFKLDWDHGDPASFGSVSRSETIVFLCQGCEAPPGAAVMIFARDVDQLYAELVERKAIVKKPPTNMPWGLRELAVADPDGNLMYFATGIEH